VRDIKSARSNSNEWDNIMAVDTKASNFYKQNTLPKEELK
jgi:hypothetical protein